MIYNCRNSLLDFLDGHSSRWNLDLGEFHDRSCWLHQLVSQKTQYCSQQRRWLHVVRRHNLFEFLGWYYLLNVGSRCLRSASIIRSQFYLHFFQIFLLYAILLLYTQIQLWMTRCYLRIVISFLLETCDAISTN